MYVITTPSGPVTVEADEHALEGQFHVFRATVVVMSRPRTVVVRRIAAGDGVTVSEQRR